MKMKTQEFYKDWISDNIYDLRVEFCNLNKDDFLKYISNNDLINNAFGRMEFTEFEWDKFDEYCKNQFEQWCKDND